LLTQDAQVLRDGWLRDALLALDDLDDVSRAQLCAAREQLQNAPSRGVAEDVEGVHQPPV
jgi:hypothetical protein